MLGMSQLDRREKESKEAYQAFLVYCMLPDGAGLMKTGVGAVPYRSNRRVSDITGIGESSVRYMRKAYGWDDRLDGLGAEAEVMAARRWADTFHTALQGQMTRRIVACMRVPYPVPMGPEKLTVREHRDAERVATTEEKARIEKVERVAEHSGELREILDDYVTGLKAAVKTGGLKYGANDIERLFKLKQLIKDLEREDKIESAAPAETIAKSERVTSALIRGDDVLDAIAEDLSELGMIVGILRDHETGGRVVAFPSGRERDGSEG